MGTLRYFRKILAAKIFFGCEGGYRVFLSVSFCLTVPKKNRGNRSMFQKFSGVENFIRMRQGSIAFFCQSFCLTLPKILLGNSPVFQNISGCGKFDWMREGEMKFFRRKFLNPSTRNFYWELFVVSEKFCNGKKLLDKMGVSQISVTQFLCYFTGKFH